MGWSGTRRAALSRQMSLPTSAAELHLTTLPLDVIDRILTTLPDYRSLAATVLSSKVFWKAFDAHHRGVLRHVARNMYGGALPMALRLARVQIRWPVIQHLTTADVESLDPETQITEETDLTGLEAKILMDNFIISQELAILFCQRYVF